MLSVSYLFFKIPQFANSSSLQDPSQILQTRSVGSSKSMSVPIPDVVASQIHQEAGEQQCKEMTNRSMG